MRRENLSRSSPTVKVSVVLCPEPENRLVACQFHYRERRATHFPSVLLYFPAAADEIAGFSFLQCEEEEKKRQLDSICTSS